MTQKRVSKSLICPLNQNLSSARPLSGYFDKINLRYCPVSPSQSGPSPEYHGDQRGDEPDGVEHHFIIQQEETSQEIVGSYWKEGGSFLSFIFILSSCFY